MRSEPARVGLAFVSLTIGMAALVALLAILGGVNHRTRAMIGELGVNVFGLVQPRSDPAKQPGAVLSRRHVELLSANLPGTIVTGLQLHEGGPAGLGAGAVVLATDEQFLRVRPWRLIAGRALDAADIREGARCAVASVALAQAMDLVPGRDVRLHNIPFKVVGIADLDHGKIETDETQRAVAPGDRLLLVPWSAPAYWSREDALPDPALDAIFVKVLSAARFDEAGRQAGNLMRQPDQAVASLSWITPQSLVRRLLQFQRLITLAGGTVVLLCLVLGGITLTSLLLTRLQTRIPEIGLRRALGASPADIGMLFMCEALLISLSATLAGIALVWGSLAMVAPWIPLPLQPDPLALLIPLASGLVLGVGFSYWPARLAARLAPAEALRNE
jgi:putative ABC transport system permease protein